jgi:hypothetical protein
MRRKKVEKNILVLTESKKGCCNTAFSAAVWGEGWGERI